MNPNKTPPKIEGINQHTIVVLGVLTPRLFNKNHKEILRLSTVINEPKAIA